MSEEDNNMTPEFNGSLLDADDLSRGTEQQPQQENNSPQNETEASSLKDVLKQAYVEAINETRGRQKKEYTEETQYEKFLIDERWGETAPDDYNTIAAAQFYVDRTPREKEVIDARLELIRAVNHKRENATDLEKYAENKDLYALSKHQTSLLFEQPGVYQAVRTYIRLIDSGHQITDINGNKVDILHIGDRDTQGEVFRNGVTGTVRKFLENSYQDKGENKTDQEIQMESVTAEQIAFNLLYVGNTYESLDAKYRIEQNGHKVREKAPSLNNGDFTHPALRGNMMPLDGLLSRVTRKEETMKPVGVFTNWARRQGQKALASVDANKFDRVVVVPEQNEASLWWTAERNGEDVVLYVPEVYPTKIMGSVWEMTEIEGRTLIDYIRSGDPIPWNSKDGDGMWGSYLDKARAGGQLFAYFKGGDKALTPAKFDAFGGAPAYMNPWMEGFTKAAGELGIRTDKNLIRWAVYAAYGLKNIEDRLPRINMDNIYKTILKKSIGYGRGASPVSLRALPIEEVLFKWEEAGILAKLWRTVS